jgi:hypothetical protein
MLESLENNELVLLMYLAGELPPVDRQEVAQMLASDAGLRSQLEKLRQSQAALEAELVSLDRSEPLPAADAAVRRIGRAMRQQQVRIAAQSARNRRPAGGHRGMPFWIYPTAAAAAVLVAYLIWVISYGMKDHSSDIAATQQSLPYVALPENPDPVAMPTDPKTTELADDLKDSFEAPKESDDNHPNDNQLFALREDPPISVGSNVSE